MYISPLLQHWMRLALHSEDRTARAGKTEINLFLLFLLKLLMQFAHGTTRYTVHFFALCNVQRMGRAILRYMAKTELHVRRLNLHSVNTALLYFQIHSLNTVLLHFEIVWQLSCKEEYFMYQTNACFCRLQVSKNWTVCLSSSALLPSHGWCELLVKLEGGH